MVVSMAGQGQNNPPEERFSGQLEQLASMGFVDRQANIQGEHSSHVQNKEYKSSQHRTELNVHDSNYFLFSLDRDLR